MHYRLGVGWHATSPMLFTQHAYVTFAGLGLQRTARVGRGVEALAGYIPYDEIALHVFVTAARTVLRCPMVPNRLKAQLPWGMSAVG
jgi:hypothetical protein